MKVKKSIKLFGIIILATILFRGPIFRALIRYHRIGERALIELTNKKLIEEISIRIGNKKLDLEGIASISQTITKEKLKFTFKKVSHDPNIVYYDGESNCMGYSSLCNSIANFIIKKQNEEYRYEATNLYGKLEIFGININGIFKSKFFKTHDYNEFIDYKTNRSVYIDPTIGDYLRINKVSAK